jgi:hypothetical protein
MPIIIAYKIIVELFTTTPDIGERNHDNAIEVEVHSTRKLKWGGQALHTFNSKMT